MKTYLMILTVCCAVGCENNVGTGQIHECAAACASTGKGMASCSATTCTCVTDSKSGELKTDNDGGAR